MKKQASKILLAFVILMTPPLCARDGDMEAMAETVNMEPGATVEMEVQVEMEGDMEAKEARALKAMEEMDVMVKQ